MKKVFLISSIVVFILSALFSFYPDSGIISHVVDPKEGNLQFYWKDNKGQHFKNHGRLKEWLSQKDKELVFAMNGGMYLSDLSPQGFYVENNHSYSSIDKQKEGYGNFYLQPNGIFSINLNGTAHVTPTTSFTNHKALKYATQSGPMLVIDGTIHSKLTVGSKNVHIRNGVGILPDGKILFAMSKKKINFYDFASFFKKQGCKNALYLDGFVSRTYLPSKNWRQLDGNFAIIIAETKSKN